MTPGKVARRRVTQLPCLKKILHYFYYFHQRWFECEKSNSLGSTARVCVSFCVFPDMSSLNHSMVSFSFISSGWLLFLGWYHTFSHFKVVIVCELQERVSRYPPLTNLVKTDIKKEKIPQIEKTHRECVSLLHWVNNGIRDAIHCLCRQSILLLVHDPKQTSPWNGTPA